MKLLFATGNPAKVKRCAKVLEERNIELITLKDIETKLEIEETGKNAIENATIKAKSYYEATGIPTIGMDNSLFIEGIPEEKQPGTHVRRVGGKELTDEEMIEYYTSLTKNYGGKLTAKWIFGMVIYDEKGANEYLWEKEHFYFVDKPSKVREKGHPLDSITIIPKYDKYLSELTEEERKAMNSQKGVGEAEYILQYIAEKEEKEERDDR